MFVVVVRSMSGPRLARSSPNSKRTLVLPPAPTIETRAPDRGRRELMASPTLRWLSGRFTTANLTSGTSTGSQPPGPARRLATSGPTRCLPCQATRADAPSWGVSWHQATTATSTSRPGVDTASCQCRLRGSRGPDLRLLGLQGSRDPGSEPRPAGGRSGSCSDRRDPCQVRANPGRAAVTSGLRGRP